MTGDADATAYLTEARPPAHSARPMTGVEQAATSSDVSALVQAALGGDEDAFLTRSPERCASTGAQRRSVASVSAASRGAARFDSLRTSSVQWPTPNDGVRAKSEKVSG